MKSKKSSCW